MCEREIKGVTALCSVPPVGGCSHCRCALSIGHSYKSGSAQFGANLLQLAAKELPSCIQAHSPEKGVRFYSFPDTTEFLTVVETPWRNWWGASRELLAGWNHGVSRCHSSFSRRLSVRLKRAECHRSGCAVESGRLLVKCRAGVSEPGTLWRTSPGPSPVCRLTDSSGSSPAGANGSPALWQRLQIFRSLAASRVGGATATPIYPPGGVQNLNVEQNVYLSI